MDNAGTIESRDDFEKTPRGQFSYWSEEVSASLKARKDWHKSGDAIVKRYIDGRAGQQREPATGHKLFRLNLFHSNVATLTAMLYGNLPKVDVSRRYADSNDDIARVAAEMMERLLNNDIADNGEEYNSVLRSTLQDRLLPGLGCARIRYEVETQETEVEVDGEMVMQEQLLHEDAPIDYFFWRDVLWSWGRSFAELNWIAYRSFLTKDEVEDRFGEGSATDMEFKKQLVTDDESTTEDPDDGSIWQKTEIWEVWDKVSGKVIFINLSGPQEIIEASDDPLKLKGFFPSPPFFMANTTTSLYAPTADFHLSQDLYNEIDTLQTRIAIITEAIKVVGVYDKSADGIQRMFKEGVENELIPVDNWALFAEKGGIAGQIDWVPIAEIAAVLDHLRNLRDETIALLYQITGMSDVLRGGSGGQYEGVGQAELKAKFGSVRVQALQDEFARFASDMMQLKAEVIARHFSPQTIVQRANMGASLDADKIPPAVELIKDPDKARLRVAIRPESVAMVDYAQLKSERTEYINALAVFLQSASPIMQQEPASKPFLLQLLQWGLAGFKGASEIEGVIDKAIEAAQEAEKERQENPQPDPAQAMEQAKAKIELQKITAKAEADTQVRQHDLQADIQTEQARHQAKLAEIDAEMRAAIAETQAKMQADILVEQAQSQANVIQAQQTAGAEIQKNAIATELEIGKEAAKTALKIKEIVVTTSAKIKETESKPAKPKGDSDAI